MDLDPKDAEIVIGVVARIGVDTKAIIKSMTTELLNYNYETREIHVTDALEGLSSLPTIQKSPVEKRYRSLIDACNTLRAGTTKDVMAKLAVLEIRSLRDNGEKPESVQERRAFIINQIKRPEEFELLRKIYGEHYVQVSCHADSEVRVDSLRKRIMYDHPENPKSPHWDTDARALINADESQEEFPNGQRMRQVFPLSDVIIDANSSQASQSGIERFFRGLFGDNSVTPTPDEYGMQLANTASQRSSDLSRQVGAAIFNAQMEVQALGCNEVAKARGGTYWEGNKGDGRDFMLGSDSNEDRRKAVLIDLMLRLQQAGGLSADLKDPEGIRKFLFDRTDNVIADAQLMDSLEYGRSVHAEMNAITDAARGGHPIRDCRLFTNTFPCHNCAKHIVAVGISEVIYNHPYPKSYAQELFADAIIINPSTNSPPPADRVSFRQFVGVLGPMFSRIFTKARWKKDGGKIPTFVKSNASFVRRTPIPAYKELENFVVDGLNVSLVEKGFFIPTVSLPKD